MNTENLTHWKKLTNPNYLGAYSLDPGEERVITIISVAREMVKGADGKEDECTVAKLLDEKPMILNSTNCKTLQKVFGTPYIEQWKNKRAIVYAAKIKAFGEPMEALRIKLDKAPLPDLLPTSAKWSGAVSALRNGTHKIADIKARYNLTDENENLLIIESTQ